MYRNILVPISFDEHRDSNQSIEVAQALADEGAQITLLHVMERVPDYATTYLPEGYLENSRQGLQDELAKLAATITGARAEVISGHSGTSILEYAESHHPDLIVLASHRPGVSDYFLGSTAHHVVRHAKCAVHVIR